MDTLPSHLDMRIHSINQLAQSIKSYDLRPVEEIDLPGFTAGAHISLILPTNATRTYSIISQPEDRSRYVIAVNRDQAGRGGSIFIHDQLYVGDVLKVLPPRNMFELNEDAGHSVLIAGGIGITPIFAMLQRLIQLNKSWELVYCARSPKKAALKKNIDEMANLSAKKVSYYFNEEPGYAPPNLKKLVNESLLDTHFYCCGPSSLMDSFLMAAKSIPSDRIHTESFAPASNNKEELGGFVVTLARSEIELYVPLGETILKTLRDAGIDIVSLCEEGTCGTCETAVLDGVPLHRDQVLSEEDKADGDTIMICCSGCKTDRLVLDL